MRVEIKNLESKYWRVMKTTTSALILWTEMSDNIAETVNGGRMNNHGGYNPHYPHYPRYPRYPHHDNDDNRYRDRDDNRRDNDDWSFTDR